MKHKLIHRNFSKEVIYARKLFAQSIKAIFGKVAVYSYISGTFAYGGARKRKSDIDVTLVFKDDVLNIPKKKFLANISKFILDYKKIHSRLELKSDTLFPGEYITLKQVEDALRGRGFSIKNKREIYLPIASDRYYLSNTETWFRAWLSSSAFSVYVSGGKRLFLANKIRAWETIILYLIKRHFLTELNPNIILEILVSEKNKWVDFGVTNRYKYFKKFECFYIKKALNNLKKQGYVYKKGNVLGVNSKKILEWENGIIRWLNNRSIQKAHFLIGLKDNLNGSF